MIGTLEDLDRLQGVETSVSRYKDDLPPGKAVLLA